MLVTAAFLPGAAVFVDDAHACSLIAVTSPEQLVPVSEVILIGKVTSADSETLVLRPEAFLKGPVSAEPVTLRAGLPGSPGVPIVGDCPRPQVSEGDRLLVYLYDAEQPRYPYINQAYLLTDGRAHMEGDRERTEIEVVSAIRGMTGQYAVPATAESEGAGINWKQTVIPLGVVMLILFGIGLVLMRVWHRIDPS